MSSAMATFKPQGARRAHARQRLDPEEGDGEGAASGEGGKPGEAPGGPAEVVFRGTEEECLCQLLLVGSTQR